MSSTVQGKKYTVVITSDDIDGGFVGVCDELNAFSDGETYDEIKKNMKEAVKLALEDTGNTSDFDMLIVQKRNE
ncbi:MAG: type II toxin-antitoxin system HicB family antitoxin [Candidatus Nitrosoabyssus spongiisocia]|nr:MAG: type II toxin-antitoxin system HicB family antitoxin [Nitrosopumilaceae archaeon AB1(1)]